MSGFIYSRLVPIFFPFIYESAAGILRIKYTYFDIYKFDISC